ncbi:hypothetical protein [Taibaiella helva]|uniref:hypothetical protein n=1 Tax=Taibaiella helva TaxID=2301235 RepID=UPI0013007E6A|nr:hypothetical protein [Taibaiella helva]
MKIQQIAGILLVLAFIGSSCSRLHLFVSEDSFVHKYKGYLLLERRTMDTSYSDDIYLNRLANLENKFSLLFFETSVDTSEKNREVLLDFFRKQSSAIELGTYCSAAYEKLIDDYSDTFSVTNRETVYILPAEVRLIQESRGAYENEIVTIKIDGDSKKIKVRSGRTTLVSINPIIGRHIIDRHMRKKNY